MERWRDPVFSKAEAEYAVEQCLANEWIKVLSEQDAEEDRLRWKNDPNQNYSDGPYRPGCVELTSAGWNAYVRLAIEQRKVTVMDLYRASGHCIWRVPGRVSLLYMSEEMLNRELAEVASASDSLVGGSLSAEHTIGEITGPYLIGP